MQAVFVLCTVLLLTCAESHAQSAGFSVFHASADPQLQEVDVYYDGFPLHPGLPFRQLSFRQEVFAGSPYQLEVTLPNTDTTIASTQLTPAPNAEYMLILLGVRTPANFAPNPDGVNTAATLLTQQLPLTSPDPDRVWLAFAHAATDVPSIRLTRANGQPLYSGSITFRSLVEGLLPADTLTVELYTLGGTLLARFRGDLSRYAGETGLLVLSGFLQPGQNQNGPALGLHAVFLDGTILPFQRVDVQAQTARVQLIHASPDPQLASVDIYLNGQKILDDFAFRSATPLQEFPAATPLTVGIARSTSQSVADTLRSFTAVLPPGSTLCAVVCGVLSPSNFAPNPNGRSTELTVVAVPVQERAPSPNTVAVATVHAVTDAPAVSLNASGIPLAQGLLYTDVAPYTELPIGSDTLRGLPREYTMDLTAYGGNAGIMVLTGFANPAANGNGPELTPIIVFPNGTVVTLSPLVGIAHGAADGSVVARLSASDRRLWLYVSEPVSGYLFVELFTLTGAHVLRREIAGQHPGWHSIPLPSLASNSVYLCRIWAPATGQIWYRMLCTE